MGFKCGVEALRTPCMIKDIEAKGEFGCPMHIR